MAWTFHGSRLLTPTSVFTSQRVEKVARKTLQNYMRGQRTGYAYKKSVKKVAFYKCAQLFAICKCLNIIHFFYCVIAYRNTVKWMTSSNFINCNSRKKQEFPFVPLWRRWSKLECSMVPNTDGMSDFGIFPKYFRFEIASYCAKYYGYISGWSWNSDQTIILFKIKILVHSKMPLGFQTHVLKLKRELNHGPLNFKDKGLRWDHQKFMKV
jgi:hypothetical protein